MNKNVLDSKPFSQEDYEAEPFFKEKEKIDNHIEKIKLQESKLDIEYQFCPHQSAPISCYCRKPQVGIFVDFMILALSGVFLEYFDTN